MPFSPDTVEEFSPTAQNILISISMKDEHILEKGLAISSTPLTDIYIRSSNDRTINFDLLAGLTKNHSIHLENNVNIIRQVQNYK